MPNTQKYYSKVDIVYDYIINKITDGGLLPGTRIIIRQIADECGVSETPVREALRLLESDGYIKIYANKGPVFTGISEGVLREKNDIFQLLCSYAYVKGAEVLTHEDYIQLRHIIDIRNEVFENNDRRKFLDLTLEFHRYIYMRQTNVTLQKMLDEILQQMKINFDFFYIEIKNNPEKIKQTYETLELMEQHRYQELLQLLQQDFVPKQ